MEIFYAILQGLAFVWILAVLLKTFYARGTAPRYQYATVEVTLRWVAIFYYTTRPFMLPFDNTVAQVLGFINVFLVPWIAYREYKSDDDNWWNGRGRKIGQWFKKNFTVPSAQALPNGA